MVNDPAVLPHHAYLAKDQGYWRVTAYDAAVPLNSGNRPTTDLPLQNGTRFSVGHAQFEFTSEVTSRRKSASAPEPRVARSSRAVPESRAEGEDPLLENPEAAVAQLHEAMKRIRAQMARVVIGQADVVNQILVALFGRGHCLLVGTPGLAKTLMARTLADSLELQCKRVQFTPDLMPADITGTQVLEQRPGHLGAPFPLSSTARFSPTSSWPMRSIARRRRRRPLCLKQCRNAGSPSPARATICRSPFLSSRRKTRSSRSEPIRCPKRSSC